MNNREWLRTLDAEALAKMLVGDCSMCIYGANGEGCHTESCVESIKKWLQAEHEEPEEHDSWDRIEEDAYSVAAQYWGCEGIPCAKCHSKIEGLKPYEYYESNNCVNAQILDIMRRCKALAERERGE